MNLSVKRNKLKKILNLTQAPTVWVLITTSFMKLYSTLILLSFIIQV